MPADCYYRHACLDELRSCVHMGMGGINKILIRDLPKGARTGIDEHMSLVITSLVTPWLNFESYD